MREVEKKEGICSALELARTPIVKIAVALWGGVLFALHFSWSWRSVMILILIVALLSTVLRRSLSIRSDLLMLTGLALVATSLILIRQGGAILTDAELREGSRISFEISARGDSDPLAKRVYGSVVQERSCSLRAESIRLGDRTREIPLRVIAKDCSIFFGERIKGNGRLRPSEEKRVAAMLIIDEITDRSSSQIWQELDRIRKGFREHFVELGDAGSLVPGMVIGDTTLQSDEFDSTMRLAGLSHLTAVSGANFSIVATLVLWLVSLGISRRRTRILIVVVVLLLFTILVRPSPSVLRAGVMAGVVLFAQLRGNPRSSLMALAGAVTLLLLVDPYQGNDAGFALSVLATLGIITLSPRLSEGLTTMWKVPRIISEVIAIPVAATIFCTPVVIAISGKLSLASIPLNIMAAPLVPAVTILGFAALLASLMIDPLAEYLAWVSHLAAWPIAHIAEWSYFLPIFEMPFGFVGGGIFIAMLLVAVYLFTTLRNQSTTVLASLFLLFIGAILFASSMRGDWQLYQCDVGQGDALLIRSSPDSAVLIDVGPDSERIDRCLRQAGIDKISLLVITHLHADHYAGIAGVLRGRSIAQWWIAEDGREESADVISTMESEIGIPPLHVESGMSFLHGEMTIDVIWPDVGSIVGPRLAGDGSDLNNRSISLLIEKDGATIFAGGDIEPIVQEEIASRHDLSGVDIYKVSHHGSRFRSPQFDRALRPSLAVISVGEGNPFGHPAMETLEILLPAKIHRTDVDGPARVSWWPLRIR